MLWNKNTILTALFALSAALLCRAGESAPKQLELDTPDFPHIDLRDLREAIDAGETTADQPLTVVGRIQRIPGTEPTQIAVLKRYMVCCAADAVAHAFRITDERGKAFENGERVIIRGHLIRLPAPDPVAAFRLGSTTSAMTAPHHVLRVATIEPFKPILYMPLLTTHLDAERTTRFRDALRTAGLLEEMRGKGPFTVLAPLNAALGALQTESLDPNALRALLSAHIVVGRHSEATLSRAGTLKTINGRELPVSVDNGRIFIQNSRIVFADQQARNGIVHVIHPAISDSLAAQSNR